MGLLTKSHKQACTLTLPLAGTETYESGKEAEKGQSQESYEGQEKVVSQKPEQEGRCSVEYYIGYIRWGVEKYSEIENLGHGSLRTGD